LLPKPLVVEAAIGLVDVTGLPDGLVQQSRPGNHRFSVCSLRAIARAACDACWPGRTALVASAAVCRIVISSVTVFLLSCPASRGAPKGEWVLLARPRAAFLEVREATTRSQNPGALAEAEGRGAASAQEWSPAHRARERKGPRGSRRAGGSRPTQQKCFHEKTRRAGWRQGGADSGGIKLQG